MSDIGTVSIINMLERVSIGLLDGATPVPDAQFPMSWALFSYWERSDATERQTFQQIVEAFLPGDASSAFNSGVIDFTFEPGMHRMRVNQPFFGLPVGAEGDMALVSYVRSSPEEQWHESGRFAVHIEYETGTVDVPSVSSGRS